MSTRASAARYARALFDVAVAESTPDQAAEDLGAFASLLDRHPELRRVLTSPATPKQAKIGVMRAVTTRAGLSSPVAKLLVLLAERDRVALLPDLMAVYNDRLMEHHRVVRAEITTAAPLDAARVAQIERRLGTATGRRVVVSARANPALIAGVVARIGSVVYDGSVATQLETMRQRLREQA